MSDEEWTPTLETRLRTLEVLGRIAEAQERFPVCPCGQRTKNLEGICSKTSDVHRQIVIESRWKT